MRPTKKHTLIGDDFGQAVTFENFTYTLPPPDQLQPSEKNSCVRFMRRNPDAGVIVRPDRNGDFDWARYSSAIERHRGNRTLAAWLEYFRFKARDDKRWLQIIDTTNGMLARGYCVQFVCKDPTEFDAAYLPAFDQELSEGEL